MARIAFILLLHKDPDDVIAKSEQLARSGDFVSIHFDARARPEHFRKIRSALADNPNVTFAKKRHKCGWGEWSLVAATLEAVKAAVEAFPRATHFYMLSGDCMPVKTAGYAHAFLDAEEVDYIESFDFFSSDWIKTGMREERLIYRHWFNERTQSRLFYTSLGLQQRFGLAREIPEDIQMMIGSQWWCLRRRTVEWVLDFCRDRPDVIRFFRTTWIPDETFFQTIVRHVVPENEIRTRTLTFLMFTDYGMPVNFYNDHYDMLLRQDYLFARKISPDAKDLKARLRALWTQEHAEFAITNEGRALHAFLTGRGRIGRRFAPRFWETGSSLGRGRTLYVVTCKKWHVAKRLVWELARRTGRPGVEYLFDEMGNVPDLGGIEQSKEKRNRHRRAFLRMLYDHYKTDELLICIDPPSFAAIRDFDADKCEMHLLEIECDFSDDYLSGHTRRIGLASDQTRPDVLQRLLPMVRETLRHETDRLRDAGFEHHALMRETAPPEANARALIRALDIDADLAHELARIEYLFVD